MSLANRLIANRDLSLIQIALELGYSDQAHFTRAFRRWTGISPAARHSDEGVVLRKVADRSAIRVFAIRFAERTPTINSNPHLLNAFIEGHGHWMRLGNATEGVYITVHMLLPPSGEYAKRDWINTNSPCAPKPITTQARMPRSAPSTQSVLPSSAASSSGPAVFWKSSNFRYERCG